MIAPVGVVELSFALKSQIKFVDPIEEFVKVIVDPTHPESAIENEAVGHCEYVFP